MEDGLSCCRTGFFGRGLLARMAKFVKASMRGWEYARANPDEAAKIVLDNDASGAQKEAHQKRHDGRDQQADGGSNGKLDPPTTSAR